MSFGKTKVSPPKLENNSKLGVFATRSPHRINPIGLTLVKLEKVVNNEVFISSVDMVSGTPIIDIKPYHHLESVQITKYPDWIKNADFDTNNESLLTGKNTVEFTDLCKETLKNILETKKLIFYENYNEIIELTQKLLEIDPHSKFTKKSKDIKLYAFYLDRLNIIYEFDANSQYIKVIEFKYCEDYKKIRNKEWLEGYTKSNLPVKTNNSLDIINNNNKEN